MDIKELDKKQLILLTLLITFVVSIATGIVTVSLMNQMPKSVPQTINNVIQRTIEKVTTVEVPNETVAGKDQSNENLLLGSSKAVVDIYLNKTDVSNGEVINNEVEQKEEQVVGQGVIVSDVGLILVDSSVVTDQGLYKVILNNQNFNVTILKRFNNGFTILQISPIIKEPQEGGETEKIE